MNNQVFILTKAYSNSNFNHFLLMKEGVANGFKNASMPIVMRYRESFPDLIMRTTGVIPVFVPLRDKKREAPEQQLSFISHTRALLLKTFQYLNKFPVSSFGDTGEKTREKLENREE